MRPWKALGMAISNKPLSNTQRATLERLATWRAATVEQLADAAGVQPRGFRKSLKLLTDIGAVKLHNVDAASPTIVELRHPGARIAGLTLPSNRVHHSWATLTHQCHVNELETRLAKHYPGRFLQRLELFKLGLNPSVAEHGYRLDSGDLWMVILDDYGMRAGGNGRVARSWSRPHAPNSNYYSSTVATSWSARADGVIVATMSKDQALRHKRYMPELRASNVTIANSTEPEKLIIPLFVTIPNLWS